eukprot:scaffold143594_cov139-Phaeocystis_antarctica.AAC.2
MRPSRPRSAATASRPMHGSWRGIRGKTSAKAPSCKDGEGVSRWYMRQRCFGSASWRGLSGAPYPSK